MASIARYLNYDDVNVLLTKDATRKNVISQIKNIASTLDKGDYFLITYSGHGGQIPDTNGDETDFLDETWCLYDGQLIDDELYNLWCEFKEGVRIFIVSDSCNSGTVTRALLMSGIPPKKTINGFKVKYLPRETTVKAYEKNKDFYDNILRNLKYKQNESKVLVSVRLFAAAIDGTTAQDGNKNGLFTQNLLSVWDNGAFTGNYIEFFNSIKNSMNKCEQIPETNLIGKENPDFDNQRPFSK